MSKTKKRRRSKPKPIALASQPSENDLSRVPSEGEETKKQTGHGFATGFLPNFPGFSDPPPATFATYRLMRANPTITVGRMVANMPVKMAKWGYTGENADRVAFIRNQIEPMRPFMIREILRGRDNGFQAFEKVFMMRLIEKLGNMIVLKKLKPLLPDNTKPLVNKETGQFAGLINQGVTLGAEKAFWYAHDPEAGDLFGRSWFESLRKEWRAWDDTLQRMGKYTNLASGPVPILHYPIGESQDASGTTVDNFQIALGIVANLASGKAVTIPDELAAYSRALLQSGVDPEKFQAWRFSYLEPKARYGADYVLILKQLDSYLLRGLMVPERAAIEGQHGTKAEAEVHAGLVIGGAQEILDDIVRCVNWYIVDQLLVLNFGESARGTVVIESLPLQDIEAIFIRRIAEKLITTPATFDLLEPLIEIDMILEQSGVPLKSPGMSGHLNNNEPDDKAASLSFWQEVVRSALATGGNGNGLKPEVAAPSRNN